MNKELLARIARLEQAIQDIWAACACLRKALEPDNLDLPNGEPFADEEELPEEPAETIECPGEDIIYCPEDSDEPEDEEPEPVEQQEDYYE